MKKLWALLFIVGCTGTDPAVDTDASIEADVESNRSDMSDDGDTQSEPDIGNVADAGVDVTASPDFGDVKLDLTVTYQGNSLDIDRAYYGLTAPAESASGELELYMEAYVGGADGCPDQDSPTPDLTVIIAGVQPPDAVDTATESDGLAVSVLDFQGTLTTEPILRATGEILAFTGSSSCVDCRDGTEQFVAFTLDAPLDSGAVSGDVVATHCTSLDAGFD